MTIYVGYPADSDVWTWTHNVSPTGARDVSLWGFAYAAQFKGLPTDISSFQSWQQQCWTWVNNIQYWDVDFLLGFIQCHGRFPNSIPDLTQYLVAGGFTSLNPNGSYAKNGNYPVGGNGYPPGSPASFALGYSGPAAVPVPSSIAAPITNPPVQNTAPTVTGPPPSAAPPSAPATSNAGTSQATPAAASAGTSPLVLSGDSGFYAGSSTGAAAASAPAAASGPSPLTGLENAWATVQTDFTQHETAILVGGGALLAFWLGIPQALFRSLRGHGRRSYR